MSVMNVKSGYASLCLGILLLGHAAAAQDLIENVVVRNRLFSTAGKNELGLNVGLTVMPRLTDHVQAHASYAYNFSEQWAVELRGGYAFSRQTGLARQVADEFAKNSGVATANDLADLWEMNGNGVLGFRWAPIYGKVSLMAELPVHFQAYVWLGGGAAQFNRTSLVYCQSGTATSCNSYKEESKVGALFSAAIGSRFFFAANHGFRLEVRDYSFLDSYRVNIVRATARAGGDTGEETKTPGITNLVQFDLGYTFIF
jgi:outer membrane beta-barrel protein